MSSQLSDINKRDTFEKKYDNDPINNPKHYDYPVSPLEFVKPIIKGMDGFEDSCVKDIVKYVVRFPLKNGVEDLKKARNYLNQLIDYEEEKQG